jgi:hypothetical protein
VPFSLFVFLLPSFSHWLDLFFCLLQGGHISEEFFTGAPPINLFLPSSGLRAMPPTGLFSVIYEGAMYV